LKSSCSSQQRGNLQRASGNHCCLLKLLDVHHLVLFAWRIATLA